MEGESEEVARPVLLLCSLSAMSLYAFWGFMFIAALLPTIQESLTLTHSVSRFLYELRSCLSLAVIHQMSVKHLVHSDVKCNGHLLERLSLWISFLLKDIDMA